MASRSFYAAPREVSPALQRRMSAAAGVAIVAFVLVGARLWYLQIERGGELRERSENNRIQPIRMPAARGVVYDRHGTILIDNRASFDAVFTPEDAPSPERREILETAARLLGEEDEAFVERLRAPAQRPPYEGIMLRRDVAWEGVVALETHEIDLPGISLRVAPRRFYPYGPLAAHLLGYVSEVSEQDLQDGGGSCAYRRGDLRGKAGLENAWDSELCGVAGSQLVEVDAHRRRVRLLKESGDRPGGNVTLTLDLDLQETAERALGENDGAIVALDPRNGEVLVMVSHPGYDPNVFARGIRPDEWHALVRDEKHPIANRAVQGQYPPGSTFKVAVAAGALSEKRISPGTTFFCPGGLQFGHHFFHCWRRGGHGTMNLHSAIVNSCDVFFYQAGQKLGIDGIADYARRLGLGLPTGIALPHEKAGIIPDTQWKRRRFDQPWFPGETLSVAIGQGYVTATPLQMAHFAATIANGGTRYRPRYVMRVEGPDGTPRLETKPEVLSEAGIAPEVMAQVRSGMRDVVMSEHGTGKKAQVEGIEVAGKTGTAQTIGVGDAGKRDARTRRDHAWFIAFAPVEAPEIAMAVLVEHAGAGGGAVAAPIAQQIMQRYFTRGREEAPPHPAQEANATRPPADRPL
jgi:penicillin-binding protein 2